MNEELREGLLMYVLNVYANGREARDDASQIAINQSCREAVDEILQAIAPLIRQDERERIRVWGNQKCLDHHTSMNNVLRRDCNECWQALKATVEKEG